MSILTWLRRLFAPKYQALPLPDGHPMEVIVSPTQGGKYKRPRLQRRWFYTVRSGDVLTDPWGNYRAVRHVSRYANGDLHWIAFAKRVCGRYGAAASYDATALRRGGWRPTGVRVQLDSEMDQWLLADILSFGSSRAVTCCEAKDMP